MEIQGLKLSDTTVLICDDEEAGKDVLLYELEQIGVENVVVCSSADEVMESLQKGVPNLCILDIEMPGTNGIELARQLRGFNCHIVFVTAYVGFALQSYDVDALDFISKPVTKRKLKRALERSIERRIAQPEKPDRYAISIRDGQEVHLLSNTDIICFLAEDKYVRVCAGGRDLLWRQTISALQCVLQSDFIRVHRSVIVNRNKIRSASKNDGRLELTLVNGKTIRVGKTFEHSARAVF